MVPVQALRDIQASARPVQMRRVFADMERALDGGAAMIRTVLVRLAAHALLFGAAFAALWCAGVIR